MGVRVPAILVSPWIEERTVFRSDTGVALRRDLDPRDAAQVVWHPEVEVVPGRADQPRPDLRRRADPVDARADAPTFTPPYDKQYPPNAAPTPSTLVHDLHRRLAHGIICTMARGKLSPTEISRLSAPCSTRQRTCRRSRASSTISSAASARRRRRSVRPRCRQQRGRS